MLNQNDILETQAMIEQQHLDIRTITWASVCWTAVIRI